MALDSSQLEASVRSLIDEHDRIEAELADPDVLADAGRTRKLTRRYSELGQIKTCVDAIDAARSDREAAAELAEEDSSFAEEAHRLAGVIADLEERLRELLVPKDPDDVRDALLEVKAGEGGDESALFAADLVNMYRHWASNRGWSVDVLDSTETALGGWKDITLAVKSREGGVYGWMKFEGGVHRVQRVPVTESQGRIHTSAAGVMVFPEVDEPDEIRIDDNDLRIDVYRSSGPGGQSVNTTDSAVRITHLPTGIVASCQNEKSQLQNREAAMRILRARLLAKQAEEAAAEAQSARRSQVRSVDRSERVRTYNFPENRIVDHRTGYKAYNLDQVLDGRLDEVVESLRAAERAERLEEIG